MMSDPGVTWLINHLFERHDPQSIHDIVKAVFAAIAFTSAIQGWFITKNKWFELPFFLLATFILFHPGALFEIFNWDSSYKYYMYIPGLVILVVIYIEQKLRIRKFGEYTIFAKPMNSSEQ